MADLYKLKVEDKPSPVEDHIVAYQQISELVYQFTNYHFDIGY